MSNYPIVHLINNSRASRKSTVARGFKLREKWNGKSEGPKMSISDVEGLLLWLDVEHSLRYKKLESQTFCNIYAYDYACQVGVYLPHLWWKDWAILNMDDGKGMEMDYPNNAAELNANALFDWLVKFSHLYGWKKCQEEDDIQTLVNEGNLGVICAKGRIGHISVVVPEGTFGVSASKGKNGKKMLLQSQAGGENKKVFSDEWYKAFKDYGFWVNIL